MKILLLGSTGRTGKLVLQEAISKGHTVNCLVRNQPGQIIPATEFFVGNPADEKLLADSMKGCEAIINVLNISRTSDFPWSKLRTSENFLSEVMSKLIPLAQQHSIRRVVLCSAWGVAETKADIPGWFRWLIDHSNIGAAYADHERQEKLLQNSGLAWTIVRPAALINSGSKQHIIESYSNEPKPRLTISRLSVANYMIDALANDQLVNKAPVISGKSI